MILSKSGNAFVVDAGYRGLLPELRKLRDAGRLRTVEGIWITHYHDDHTDYIGDVSAEFHSPVYFTDRMSEVMGKPGGFRLPCLTTKGVPTSGAKRDGETLDWHEWKFTFWHFPGQTLYHGGLVAMREDGQTYLFTGDSFTPSGMDDYCMQNRDILRQGEGYEFCLRRIASLPENTWLLNQHVEPMFRYTGTQVKRMQTALERSAALAELSPWPDINYMVDESWARVFPYGRKSGGRNGRTRIADHKPRTRPDDLQGLGLHGLELIRADREREMVPRGDGVLRARVRATVPGLHVVTADLSFTGRELKQWTEALVRVR